MDGKTDPFVVARRGVLAHMVNLSTEDGVLRTRPGFHYHSLGIAGQFQGMSLFCPSLGLSVESFGHNGAQLATAVSGGIYLNGVTANSVGCNPMKLPGTEETNDCGPEDPKCRGDINLFQAENYLIVQNRQGSTYWWDGTTLTPSPGMVSDVSQGEENHSHDSVCATSFRNWLVNGAGLGIFAHGRIHQEANNRIFVSDILHKRGVLMTDDILLMEEQSLASCGPPLSTNSKMGRLIALEITPQMGTANGEGELVGYYEGGVVTYNTFEAPRATLVDGEGKEVTQGWDKKRLVNHRLNNISAAGRYSVAQLPRDQLFRSFFGVHFLSAVAGSEVINDEPINTVSQEVEPILDSDNPDALHGTACGYWIRGHRYFVSTGLNFDERISSSPSAKGFVVWNKLFSRTQDRTPIPAWEGVWVVDPAVAGIHRFSHIGLRADEGGYGFMCSDTDRNILFATVHPHALDDYRDGKTLPIPWALETGRYSFSSLSVLKTIRDARFEGVFSSHTAKVKVLIRTDRKPAWAKWREFSPCERKLEPTQRLLKSEAIGQPPEGYREAAWFEIRIEGVGWAEIRGFDVDVTESQLSAGNSVCVVVDSREKNYLSSQI
jgi:hypothetical protein